MQHQHTQSVEIGTRPAIAAAGPDPPSPLRSSRRRPAGNRPGGALTQSPSMASRRFGSRKKILAGLMPRCASPSFSSSATPRISGARTLATMLSSDQGFSSPSVVSASRPPDRLLIDDGELAPVRRRPVDRSHLDRRQHVLAFQHAQPRRRTRPGSVAADRRSARNSGLPCRAYRRLRKRARCASEKPVRAFHIGCRSGRATVRSRSNPPRFALSAVGMSDMCYPLLRRLPAHPAREQYGVTVLRCNRAPPCFHVSESAAGSAEDAAVSTSSPHSAAASSGSAPAAPCAGRSIVRAGNAR